MRLGGKFVPILSLLIPFILGILFCEYNSAFNFYLLLAIEVALLGICLFAYFFRKKWLLRWTFFLSLVVIGCIVTGLHKDEYQEASGRFEKLGPCVVELDSRLKETNKHTKFIAHLISPNVVSRSNTNILINVPKSYSEDLYIGDSCLLVKFAEVNLEEELNPYEFDYRDYLRKKGIHGEVYMSKGGLTLMGRGQGMLHMLDRFRMKSSMKFDETLSDDAANFAMALVLGLKGGLGKETKWLFTQGGVMHVLSVSGLHVGIVFLLLGALFNKFPNYMMWSHFKMVSVLTGIWIYATLAGFSVPVVRASIMFSVLQIGQLSNRKGNVLNSLFFSALVLLAVNPFYLFQVGFQFSYLAVLGIVLFYPFLDSLVESRYKLVEKMWSLVSVAVSAQVFVVFLSIYYFHTFSILFVVTNIIVVPLTAIQLVLGICLVAFQNMHFMQVQIGFVFDLLFSVEVGFLKYLARLNFAIIKDVFIGLPQLLAYSLVLLLLFLTFMRRSFAMVLRFSCALLLVCSLNFFYSYSTQNQNEVISFAANGICLGHLVGDSASLLVSSSVSEKNLESKVMPYLLHRGIEKIKVEKLNRVREELEESILFRLGELIFSSGTYTVNELFSDNQVFNVVIGCENGSKINDNNVHQKVLLFAVKGPCLEQVKKNNKSVRLYHGFNNLSKML